MFDGHDLRQLPLDVLRRQVAVVAQDTYLFYGTVTENLRVARPEASQTELEAACVAANAHGFIADLPHGYDTVIGERGVRLSGGQRQRLAIARALLKDAPILVLDEALSSVDAENEAAIQQALERLQRGRTTLVIAHRLSSVATADRIIVLERGRLVEEGEPSELLARPDGAYRRLMAAQQSALDGTARVTFAGLAAADEPGLPSGPPQLVGAEPLQPNGLPASQAPMSDATGGPNGQLRPPAPAASQTMQLRQSQVWRRLFQLVEPWRGETALVLALGPLHAASQVALGVVSALLVANVFTRGDLTPWLWALAVLVPITAVLRWLDSWISHDLAYRLLAELRIKLYQLLDPLAPAYLVRRRSGDLVSALLGDVELIELFYAHTISPLFVAILVPAGVLIALGVQAPALAVVLVPFLVAVALTPLVAVRQSAQLGAALRDLTAEVTAHAVDSVQGLRTIAAFDYGARRAEEIARRSRDLGELKRRFLRWQAVQNSVIEAAMGLGALAVLTAGARLVADGQLVRTALPLAMLLAGSAFLPVVTIVTVFKELAQTLGGARRFFAVEDEPVAVRDGPRSLAHVDDSSVHFDGVTFSYGAGLAPALRGVTF
ncbi:MAG TPA: ABC transporter transmembrane domain-containing protein, partial [Chloroflexota bacterium]|nr:ABC transporter transmembrane domain-containing protein [Chloroflexota bacterium]